MAGIPTSSKSSPNTLLFPVFALTWACAALVHQVAASFWMTGWAGWLLIVAAFAVVFEPRCLLRFTILIVASLLNLYQKLPFVPNHILFEGMLHSAMLLGVLQLAIFGKFGDLRAIVARLSPRAFPLAVAAALKAFFLLAPFVPKHEAIGCATTLLLAAALGRYLFMNRRLEGRGEWFIANISSVIRVALVLLYVLAVVQKLNWDYLDPAVCCAVVMNAEIAACFPFLPFSGWILEATIWGTFVFELAIPLLLLFPRTRSLGFLIAILFHMWLAVHRAFGIYSFSSLAFAILILFLPHASISPLKMLWQRQLAWLGRGDEARGRSMARWGVVVVCSGVMLIQAACYLLIERSLNVFWTANRFGFALFLGWGVWLTSSLLVALFRSRRDSRSLPYHVQPTWAWLAIVLIVFNGICPWIGLKTQTTFSMYSNLRSEEDGNHFFLRRVDLFDYQSDMVELVSSEPNLLAIGTRPQGIQQFANRGRIFPWFELRRLVSETNGDIRLEYRRGSEQFQASRIDGRISGDPELFEKHPILLSKLLWFRRHVSLEGPMHCTH